MKPTSYNLIDKTLAFLYDLVDSDIEFSCYQIKRLEIDKSSSFYDHKNKVGKISISWSMPSVARYINKADSICESKKDVKSLSECKRYPKDRSCIDR